MVVSILLIRVDIFIQQHSHFGIQAILSVSKLIFVLN